MEGKSSNESDVLRGVAQGTVIRPLLFFLFIGDIGARIQDGNTLCFTDNTRVIMKIKQLERSNKLQEDLKAVYRCPENNSMMFNAGKFQRLSYGVTPPSHQSSEKFKQNPL